MKWASNDRCFAHLYKLLAKVAALIFKGLDLLLQVGVFLPQKRNLARDDFGVLGYPGKAVFPQHHHHAYSSCQDTDYGLPSL